MGKKDLYDRIARNGMEFMNELFYNIIEVLGFDPETEKYNIRRLKEKLDAQGIKITIYNAYHKPYLRYIRATKNDHFMLGYIVELKGYSGAIETFEHTIKFHATLIEDDEQDETAVKYLSGGLDHLSVERKGEEK